VKAAGASRPQALDWHLDGLWRTCKRMVFPDGRLLRIGGDTRVRYAYCQDYALPAFLYAADHFNDPHALGLAQNLVGIFASDASADGSFFSARLSDLKQTSPYFVTRLESDRACVLAHLAAVLPRIRSTPPPSESTVTASAGAWHDPDHAAALVRSTRRVASVAWRAKGLAQVLCLPPEVSNLADWRENLTGTVRFIGETESMKLFRDLKHAWVQPFSGGFLAGAEITEGIGASMPENWTGTYAATSRIAVVALPDDASVVCLRLTVNGAQRAYVRLTQGLRLLVPNDLFNGKRRTIASTLGEQIVTSPAEADSEIDLGGAWACVDDHIGAVGLYGAERMTLHRSREARGGMYRSLHVDELSWGLDASTRSIRPGATILDGGWLALCGDRAITSTCAAEHVGARKDDGSSGLRMVSVHGRDHHQYVILANLGLSPLLPTLPAGYDVLAGSGNAMMASTEVILLRRR
jgi:hypothetical protein